MSFHWRHLRERRSNKDDSENWNKINAHLKILGYSPLRCSRCNHSHSLICMLMQSCWLPSGNEKIISHLKNILYLFTIEVKYDHSNNLHAILINGELCTEIWNNCVFVIWNFEKKNPTLLFIDFKGWVWCWSF